MREEQVKKAIGEDNWEDFLNWMHGQTVGVYNDGETNYYDWDVDRYKSQLFPKHL